MLAEEGLGGDRLLRALDHIQHEGPPLTIAGWKAVAEGLVVDERCAADRNRQISSCYAWAYMALPTTFKWAGMAAIASHHVRVALLPLHLQTRFRGSPAQLRGPVGWRVLTRDANTLRATNNAIFDNLFWVHLAYVTSGIGLLRTLLRDERGYAPVLAAFEALDRGRWVLEDATASPAARGRARDLVWEGNLLLLEHEQRFVVQPRFDRLSDRYAPVVSIGSATTFETHDPWRSIEHFTSFYLYTLARTNPRGLGGRLCPRITNYDDRWRWLVSSVVPRFRRVDTDPLVIRAVLRRILDEDRRHPSSPVRNLDRERRGVQGARGVRGPGSARPEPSRRERQVPHRWSAGSGGADPGTLAGESHPGGLRRHAVAVDGSPLRAPVPDVPQT